MANPNIVNVTSIYGNTAYIVPATSVTTPSAANGVVSWTYNGTTALTGLTPAVGSVNKIDSIVVTNTSASAVSATVAIGNNPTFASATVLGYIAYKISVPANASLMVTDKTTTFYVTENQSVAVFSSSASNLTFVAAFEVIT
jgi:hypothetical protein